MVGIPSGDNNRGHRGPNIPDASEVQTIGVVHWQESEGDRWVCLTQPDAMEYV